MRRFALLIATATALAPTAYDRLAGAQLKNIATKQPVALTEQWNSDQKVVRDALPALNAAGVKLLVVGIGSVESGETFAKQTSFSPELLFVDDSELSDAYAAAGTRNTKRDDSGKAVFEASAACGRGDERRHQERGRDDLNAVTGNLFNPGPYKPLMPKASTMRRSMEQTMVQGGSFVFDGDSVVAGATRARRAPVHRGAPPPQAPRRNPPLAPARDDMTAARAELPPRRGPPE
ncbi:prostaglandin-F synthase [Aureococcus anophagefferens]|nr:prostaglandin-F synthase [Aureococcus anophagefferens]